jgi:hypothetical protein
MMRHRWTVRNYTRAVILRTSCIGAIAVVAPAQAEGTISSRSARATAREMGPCLRRATRIRIFLDIMNHIGYHCG